MWCLHVLLILRLQCKALHHQFKQICFFSIHFVNWLLSTEIPSVRLSKSEMVVKPGDSVSVFCNASGHPKPTIQWLNRNREGGMVISFRLLAHKSSYFTIILEEDLFSQLLPSSIKSFIFQIQIRLRCYVLIKRCKSGGNKCNSTPTGHNTYVFFYFISALPNITSNISLIYLQNCSFKHSSQYFLFLILFPVYVFITKSSTGRVRAVESQLQIENVVISDGGDYSCKVTNEAGNNTQNFTLMSKSQQNNFVFSHIIIFVGICWLVPIHHGST